MQSLLDESRGSLTVFPGNGIGFLRLPRMIRTVRKPKLVLDDLVYRAIIWGFPFLTAGIITVAATADEYAK